MIMDCGGSLIKRGSKMARVLMVVAMFVIFYGCGQKTMTPSGADQQNTTPRAAGIVKLTFDDGPVARTAPVIFLRKDTPLDGNTPAVLDVLRKFGVPATFFVVGKQVRKYPELVHREYSEGHSVQNHSYTHRNFTKHSKAQVARELRMTNQAITEAGVPRPHIFRPPYGITNDRVRSVGASLGLRQIRWTDKPSEDWDDPPASVICKRVVRQVRPGSVVLLHDGSGANTDDALPCIIRELRAKGYGFGKL
jgi:peptidoglycan/xylan/chitin deacetylase (PgdA/CDA1 family)